MRLLVNGRSRDVGDRANHTLLDVLRDSLGLTGTKLVCDRGECGACTVLLDGDPAYACLTLAGSCEDRAITTIEGLSAPGSLHAVQTAFAEHDAAQCGFCTPGQILAAAALLAHTPHPSEREVRLAMSGNLCRCGTYPKIVRAVMAVGAATSDPVDG